MRKLLAMSFMLFACNAQAEKKHHYFPAWTFHVKQANIYGVSAGISDFIEVAQDVHTYGVRISLIGEGILSFALPHSPIPASDSAFKLLEDDLPAQRVNGFNLSGTGTMANCNVNGFSAGGITQAVNKINGFSVVTSQNYVMVNNGIQVSGFINEAYKMRGIQIGVVNKSRQTRGLQIGLWNVNEKRKMPVINWNFRNNDEPA